METKGKHVKHANEEVLRQAIERVLEMYMDLIFLWTMTGFLLCF